MMVEEERAEAQKTLTTLERIGPALAATANLTPLDRNQAAGFANELGETTWIVQSAASSFGNQDDANAKRHHAFIDIQALKQALGEHWDKPQHLQQLHETAVLSLRDWLSAISVPAH
jgi:hypothetical protein